MADFNDAVLQKLEELTNGQQLAREEMNAHFLRINGRLRAAETKIEALYFTQEAVQTPALEEIKDDIKGLKSKVEAHGKTLSRVKTVIGTVTGTVTSLWGIVTNWDTVKIFISKLLS